MTGRESLMGDRRPRCTRGHFLGLSRVSDHHDGVIACVLVWGCKRCKMVTSNPPPRWPKYQRRAV